MYGLTVYTDEELKKIQSLELDALKEIIRICNTCNIEYFLVDGAAIGAVRHHGFIPWDDDIDVGMTRDNYRKFLEAAPSLLSTQYFLQTPYDNKKSPYFYTKLRINGTQFVEYSNRKLDINHGVYVDICPYDEVPDDERLNEQQYRKCQALIHLFVWRQSPSMSKPPENKIQEIKALFRILGHYALKIIPYRCIANAIEQETTKYDETGQSALSFLHYPKRNIDYIKKSELYPLRTCDFEGIKVKIPNDFDAYLTRHDGNYLKLPPENGRYGHKPYYIRI